MWWPWGYGRKTDRGTITGTIADPAGAVVASAAIEARNVATGAIYEAASSATGNYTIAQLPAGAYEVSVTVPGFSGMLMRAVSVTRTSTFVALASEKPPLFTTT